ncbi:CYTH4 [Acrasis kona]|uniref:CYTH4 n=1 Tax=Acrasis kona TaxID=1008807 RepID=A0AAW2YMT2_9EUKA
MPSVPFLEKHPKYVRSGWLYKQGGSVKTVTKRYCVLFGNELFYFKQADDEEHKGSIQILQEVDRLEEPVEFQKKGVKFGKIQILKSCIAIPAKKRGYKFWSDSEILADEWAECINKVVKAVNSANVEEESDDEEEEEENVPNSTPSTLEDDFSVEKKVQETTSQSFDQNDGFNEDQFLAPSDECMIHFSIKPTEWRIEPYSKRKVKNQLNMTLEKAVLDAKPGDCIVLNAGKHFITRTLYLDRSISVIGEDHPEIPNRGAEIIMVRELEDLLTSPQPMFCIIAPFVKIENIKFTLACVCSNQQQVQSQVDDESFDIPTDSRTLLNQMLNASTDMVVNQRHLLGLRLSKSILQINRGQTILSRCQISIMQHSDALSLQDHYDAVFSCGSSQLSLFNCELSHCKHGICTSMSSHVHVSDCNIRDMKRHGLVLTQNANADVRNCEFSRNEKCGVCVLNESHIKIKNSKFKSCTFSACDRSKINATQNIFGFTATLDQQRNVHTQSSLVVIGDDCKGEFSNNSMTCGSSQGSGVIPVLCFSLIDRAVIKMNGNVYKREGLDVGEPYALVTGSARVVVQDYKQKKVNLEYIKCYEKADVVVE